MCISHTINSLKKTQQQQTNSAKQKQNPTNIMPQNLM
jgi:hypothetical protein